MQSNLHSFEDVAKKAGCRSHRELFSICKELEILDHERWPLTPWRHMGLFEVREIKLPSGFNVPQTFATEKGFVFLLGVVVGTRKTSKTICSRNTKTQNRTGTPGSAEKSPGTST